MTSLKTTGSFQYTWRQNVRRRCQFGMLYDLKAGPSFLSHLEPAKITENPSISSTDAAATVGFALRPRFEAGVWAGAGVAEGKAMVWTSIDFFADVGLQYSPSFAVGGQSQDHKEATYKLWDHGLGVDCSAQAHDLRVLVTVCACLVCRPALGGKKAGTPPPPTMASGQPPLPHPQTCVSAGKRMTLAPPKTPLLLFQVSHWYFFVQRGNCCGLIGIGLVLCSARWALVWSGYLFMCIGLPCATTEQN